MNKWIALLRGINVGGHNIMPMAKLKTAFEAHGCKDVRTYIQSGNVVFRSAVKKKLNLSSSLSDAIVEAFGFRPKLLLLTAAEFLEAKTNNPFPEAVDVPKSLHFFFLDSAPQAPNINAIASLAAESERYKLDERIFYFHTPGGLGTSKLASKVERLLGVDATARNYATVEKIAEMIEE